MSNHLHQQNQKKSNFHFKQLLFLTTVVCQTAGQGVAVSYYSGVSDCRSRSCCFLLQWCVRLQVKELLFLTTVVCQTASQGVAVSCYSSVSGCRSSSCFFFLFCFCFAEHIIVGRLFRNIHPSLQYSSHSCIQVKQLLFLTTVVSDCRSSSCCFLLHWCVRLQVKQLLYLKVKGDPKQTSIMGVSHRNRINNESITGDIMICSALTLCCAM